MRLKLLSGSSLVFSKNVLGLFQCETRFFYSTDNQTMFFSKKTTAEERRAFRRFLPTAVFPAKIAEARKWLVKLVNRTEIAVTVRKNSNHHGRDKVANVYFRREISENSRYGKSIGGKRL